ncbi:MAG: two-component system response regulator TorR [Rhodospirillales bacterium]|jgi:two-component system, OmpR family, torCAD operon response regulator TorR|nr:two-component system response regulator TorR [Rhodospirillales bacterium]
MESAISHILIVEDEPVTRMKLAGYFEQAGYRVSEAENGVEMRKILTRSEADLLLLDINLPGEDGLILTREVRSQSDEVGIILVTGRTDEIDRIIGLEMGADDYVTKPFNQRELLARVKNLLRRTQAVREARRSDARFRFADWTFDIPRRRLMSPDDERVELTRAEYELLAALVRHPGQVMSRDRLLDNVTHRSWEPNDRTIDVLVRRLRQKIEPDPKKPEFISTAHGEGYVFTAEVS